MRENRLSGSEGGGTKYSSPYPYSFPGLTKGAFNSRCAQIFLGPGCGRAVAPSVLSDYMVASKPRTPGAAQEGRPQTLKLIPFQIPTPEGWQEY